MTKKKTLFCISFFAIFAFAGGFLMLNQESESPEKEENIISTAETTTTTAVVVSEKNSVDDLSFPEMSTVKDINDAEVVLSKTDFVYSGEEILLTGDGLPQYFISLDGEELTEDDYYLEYSNNIDAGFNTASATFVGKGNFLGEKTVAFSILPASVKSIKAERLNDSINISWEALSCADEYEIQVSNTEDFSEGCISAETANCSFSLSENIVIGTDYYFRVRAYIFKDAEQTDKCYGAFSETVREKIYGTVSTVSVSNDYFTYDNAVHQPAVSVYDSTGKILSEGQDYSVEIPESILPGRYIITVKGINAYQGQAQGYFDILPICNSVTSLSSTDNNIVVSWEKDVLADGYIITYSMSSDFTNYYSFTQTDINQTSVNLVSYPKEGQTWYVKVCSFIYTNGTDYIWRGYYSTPKSIVVKGKPKPVIEVEEKPSTETDTKPSKETVLEPQKQEDSTLQTGSLIKLKTSLEKMIAGYNGSWSVYVQNLRTDESFVINDRTYYPASVMKLFCMAATYQKIEDGSVKENDVASLLKDMITVSSNEAFNQLVVNKIGVTAVSDWIKSNGYANTYQCAGYAGGSNYQKTIIAKGSNYTNVYDCGKLLESIYKGTCVSETASSKMMSLLKAQTITFKIPYVIPKNVVVANKTGEVNSYNHDCAVVFLDGNPYILCVMSENTGTAMGYTWCIRNISKAVYDYMVAYN